MLTANASEQVGESAAPAGCRLAPADNPFKFLVGNQLEIQLFELRPRIPLDHQSPPEIEPHQMVRFRNRA